MSRSSGVAARTRARIEQARTDAALHAGNDRALTSRQAADVARECFPALGITRVARVTGLDRIGIPVWTAIRPNALSLSVSQGKGSDDDAAVASAIFEAAEIAIAERKQRGAFAASTDEIEEAGGKLLDVSRYLRRGHYTPGGEETSWLEGLDVLSDASVFVPEDVVRVADVPGCCYWQTSDGLGTGSNILEAAVHAICELIERDAMALWSFLGDAEVATREISPGALQDAAISEMTTRIADSGFSLRLFEATSDVRVPTFLALLIDRERGGREIGYMDVASGSGTHPVVARAALRAITEAAQTRLTTITGARDDVNPQEYERELPADLRIYTQDRNAAPGSRAVVKGYIGERSLAAYFDWIIARLREAKIRSLAIVPMDAPVFPFTLVRVLAPELEQDPRSGNRRPGRRLIRAMMRAQ